VRHTSAQFEGAGGARLHLQAWLPASDPAAVLAVAHGYGEHGGRHTWLAESMAPRGYSVYAYDLRGHGHSTGDRGQVGSFREYLDDTGLFLDEVRRRQPGLPVFLLGHSFGGLIVTTFVADRPEGLAGVILSSPFLRLATDVPKSREVGVRLLAVVWPGRDIGNTLRAEDLSHEPEVAHAYTTDPLVHHRAPARWAAETLAAQEAAPACTRITLPLLVLLGDCDVVAHPGTTEEFFAAAASPDKTLVCYEGYYHELFNETGRERVFGDLADWLGKHLPQSPARPVGSPASPA
jgi:alpha-beta hydrolase superfamily lysophospholipase